MFNQPLGHHGEDTHRTDKSLNRKWRKSTQNVQSAARPPWGRHTSHLHVTQPLLEKKVLKLFKTAARPSRGRHTSHWQVTQPLLEKKYWNCSTGHPATTGKTHIALTSHSTATGEKSTETVQNDRSATTGKTHIALTSHSTATGEKVLKLFKTTARPPRGRHTSHWQVTQPLLEKKVLKLFNRPPGHHGEDTHRTDKSLNRYWRKKYWNCSTGHHGEDTHRTYKPLSRYWNKSWNSDCEHLSLNMFAMSCGWGWYFNSNWAARNETPFTVLNFWRYSARVSLANCSTGSSSRSESGWGLAKISFFISWCSSLFSNLPNPSFWRLYISAEMKRSCMRQVNHFIQTQGVITFDCSFHKHKAWYRYIH